MLTNVQKDIFKKVHSWLLQDAHALHHQGLAQAHPMSFKRALFNSNFR